MPTRSFLAGRPACGRPLLDVLRGPLRLSREEALRCLRQRLVSSCLHGALRSDKIG
jgi:hypothetical protein